MVTYNDVLVILKKKSKNDLGKDIETKLNESLVEYDKQLLLAVSKIKTYNKNLVRCFLALQRGN